MLARCRVLTALLITLPGLLVSGLLQAQGLGQITLNSALNEPLDAEVEILQLGGIDATQLQVSLASQEDFNRFNIERLTFLQGIDFEVEVISASRGVIHLSTTRPVVEPYLSFLLDTRWPSGRQVREYTVLLDLPTFAEASASASPAQVSEPAASTPIPVPEPEPEPEPQQQEPESLISATQAAPPEQVEPEQTPEPAVEPEPVPAEPEAELVAQAQVNESVEVAPPREESASLPVDAETAAPMEQEEPEQEEQTVTTEANDTLWAIALETRPDSSVSVQQMMLAIQRSNQNAFIDNNINGLRTGQVLRIPEIDEILALNQQQAVAGVQDQNASFAQSRGVDREPLAVNSNQDISGGAAESGDELTVLSGGENVEPSDAGEDLDATIAALENELMLSEENLDRALIENQDLSSRVQDLEAQVETLQNIIAIEDQRLAQLQAELAAQAEAEAAAVASQPASPVTAPATTAVPTDNSLMAQLTAMLQNSYILFGALFALLLLVLGFLIWRRRQAEEFAEDDFHPKTALAGAGGVTAAPLSTDSMGTDENEDSEWDDAAAVSASDEDTEAQASLSEDDEVEASTGKAGFFAAFTGIFSRKKAASAEDETYPDEAESGEFEDEDAYGIDDTAEDGESAEPDDEIEPDTAQHSDSTAAMDEDDLETRRMFEDLGFDEISDFELDYEDDGVAGAGDDNRDEDSVRPDSAIAGGAAGAMQAEQEDSEILDMSDLRDTTLDDSLRQVDDQAVPESEMGIEEAGSSLSEGEEATSGTSLDNSPGTASAESLGETADSADEAPHAVDFDAGSLPDVNPDPETATTELDEEDVLDFELDESADEPVADEVPESSSDSDIESFEFKVDSVEDSDDTLAGSGADDTAEDVETFEFRVEDETLSDSGPEQTEDDLQEEVETFEFSVDEPADASNTEPDEAADNDADDNLVEFEGLPGSVESGDKLQGDAEAPAPGDDLDFSFEVDEPDTEQVPDKQVEGSQAGGESAGKEEDFDFDIEFEKPEAASGPQPDTSVEDDDPFDLGNLDIDEDLLVPDEEEDVAIEPLTDRDEVSTKLDLAVAYEAMGDIDGAQEILDEVIAEGNEEQVSEARKLKEQWQQSDSNS